MEAILYGENFEERIARILNADERLLQAVLDQMPSGAIVAEAPSGRVLFHNREATNILKHPLIETPDASAFVSKSDSAKAIRATLFKVTAGVT